MAENEDLGIGNDDHLDSLEESNGYNGTLNETELLNSVDGHDTELENIKARVREMEEEAEKLKQLQSEVDKRQNTETSTVNPLHMTAEEKGEADLRSIYVGNVDYGANAEELESHFHGCGSINRVTILCNKADGHPKGFAYIEFAELESVQTAMAMDESLFRGRQIKIMPKRTNKPGMCITNRPPRGTQRGYRGGSYRSRPIPFYGYRPVRRPSRRGYFSPY